MIRSSYLCVKNTEWYKLCHLTASESLPTRCSPRLPSMLIEPLGASLLGGDKH